MRTAHNWLSLCVCLMIFSAAFAQQTTASTQKSMQRIVSIESIKLLDTAHPEQSSILPLPVLINRPKRGLMHLQSVAQFALEDVPAGSRWQLYCEELIDGGTLWINGVEIANLPTSSKVTTVWLMKPYSFDIPNGLLKTGTNTLTREWSVRENQVITSQMHLGHKEMIEPLFSRQYFMQNTMAQASFALSLVIALLMLGIFAKNTAQLQYLYIGLCALGWGLLNLFYILPSLPASLFAYLQLMLYLGVSTFCVAGCSYMLQECGKVPRWFSWVGWGWGGVFSLSYIVNYWITDRSILPLHTPIWHVGLVLLGVYSTWNLIVAALKKRSLRQLATMIVMVLALAASIMDITTLQTRSLSPTSGYLLPVVAPAWFLVVCFILISDFNQSLRVQKMQRLQLEVELAQQRQELDRLHQLERIAKEKQATVNERSRIMQDMHDGLGSQLVSSLAMARGGDLSADQTYDLLRSCIDDLRLAIDTSSDTQDSLALALGNLRFRMSPRLSAAGIDLRWNTQHLHHQLPLPIEKKLPILRIIQEFITNTLKHARAKTLSLKISSSQTHLTVNIGDDGVGFDLKAQKNNAHGKGLNSLEKRSRMLNAQLKISSSSQGTQLELVVPLNEDQQT